MRRLFGGLGLGAALVLAACGGSDMGAPSTHDTSGARGSLVYSPPLRITGMDAAEFTARLQGSAAGQGLLQVSGAPRCGVLFHYIEYGTVGGAAEPTRASGALMLPTG
ncbi:MAG TPA: alpha/beta hydrolase, partial [Giesbergeria sp.]|nr:alpha/beta hydrolase [Giesbergeria sp.]